MLYIYPKIGLMIEFWLNDKPIRTNCPPGMVLLDFIRYEKNLKGTKIGCREGDCGACTVLVGTISGKELQYQNMTSCLLPLQNAQGKHIVTVEGINQQELTPFQQAIVDEGGTQCGFCTVGFVMSLAGFCLQGKPAEYKEGIKSIDGNICRCTGYKSLERAVEKIVAELRRKPGENQMEWLVNQGYVPGYFHKMYSRLEAISIKKYPEPEGLIVGGGTDLYVQRHDQMVHASILSVFDKPELNRLEREGDILKIGAACTVSDLEQSFDMQQMIPRLGRFLKLVSSSPIRNMATLAGNFVNASPIGDMSIFFLALNASIVLEKNSVSRKIPLKDFFQGYKKLDKKPDEMIVSIEVAIPAKPIAFNFEKVSKRTHLDIASVNSAISLMVEENRIIDAHVATGGVFAFPRYLSQTAQYLAGKRVQPETILEAAKILQTEIAPISDVRGSEEYKRLLARQLFYNHFITSFPEQIKADDLLPSPIM